MMGSLPLVSTIHDMHACMHMHALKTPALVSTMHDMHAHALKISVGVCCMHV